MRALAQRVEAVELGDVPVLRVFASPRFRLAVALILALAGVGMTVVRLTQIDLSDPGSAFDFAAYYYAAERMLAGESPYMDRQMVGAEVAYCRDCYLYPPFLAQALMPVALLPIEIAKVVWWVAGYAAALGSTWLATGIGGAQRSLERALWCLVATVLFGGVASALWVGNVGSLVALGVTLVAMGGVAAGFGAAFSTLLKVQPAVLIPAVIASGKRALLALVATFAAVLGIGFVLAPDAWLAYPSVLSGVLSTPSEADANLAPAAVAATMGLPSLVKDIVRIATLVVGSVGVVVSVWLARRPSGMPAAALVGTVSMLVIPGTLWFHYLAVLLPFAAMSWPRASRVSRVVLIVGALMMSPLPYAIHALPVYAGSLAMVIVSGIVLWPRSSSRRQVDISG